MLMLSTPAFVTVVENVPAPTFCEYFSVTPNNEVNFRLDKKEAQGCQASMLLASISMEEGQ